MGGFFKDINERGMIMQLLYLNDWSMQGGGSLTSQWSKVEQWYELITFLSSTYGIAKVGVPHDFNSESCVTMSFQIVIFQTIHYCLRKSDNYYWLYWIVTYKKRIIMIPPQGS